MDTFSAIEQRRSIKHFDPSAKMTDTEFNKLMTATVQSPTSFNIQNWRFIRVTDPALRIQLQQAAYGQAQVSEASELIILCANLQAWQQQPERYWRNAPEPVQAIMLPMIDDFYRNKDQVVRDETYRSCGIASQTLMLAAKAMGYDSCPMIGFDAEQVAQLIKLPDDHMIAYMVAIGKATEPAMPRGGQLPLSEVVINNFF